MSNLRNPVIFVHLATVEEGKNFYVLPFRRSMTDEQVARAVERILGNQPDAFDVRDPSNRRIGNRRAARETVQYAISNNCKFWWLVENDFVVGSISRTCMKMPSAHSVYKKVARKMKWNG